MAVKTIQQTWKHMPLWTVFFFYWLLCAWTPDLLKFIGFPAANFWHANTAIMLILAAVCVFTERFSLTLWKKIVLIPGAFIVHAIFTIPAAITLGVLKFSPDHIRTQGEHQAIFFLSSLPVVVFVMWCSRIFVKSGNNPYSN